jgi:ABC-2 type transport system permease protein
MHKILAVIRREYLASVKTKMFWIGTLALPLFLVVIFGLSVASQFVDPGMQKRLALIDGTVELARPIADALAEHELDDERPEFLVEEVAVDGTVEATRDRLEPRVLNGSLYGIVTIGPDLNGEDNYKLYRKAVGDEGSARTIRRAIHGAAVGLRLKRSELAVEREQLEQLVQQVRLQSYQVREGETKKKGFGEAWVATFAFVLTLFFTLYFYGFAISRSIIQEKSNRVIEVLLGSLSSDQLMTGKIVGVGLVGLTQVGIYAVTSLGFRFAVATRQGDVLGDVLTFSKVVYFVLFFLLGYFLFSSLFAIIGAVCNTEQDAQQLQFPVMMTLMVPYLTTFFFVKHPDSTASVVASFIPIFTPMVMMMRISVLTPPFWQILLSMLIMLATIYLMFRAAAKVFRIGTLMYGKRPRIGEIVRWARS